MYFQRSSCCVCDSVLCFCAASFVCMCVLVIAALWCIHVPVILTFLCSYSVCCSELFVSAFGAEFVEFVIGVSVL